MRLTETLFIRDTFFSLRNTIECIVIRALRKHAEYKSFEAEWLIWWRWTFNGPDLPKWRCLHFPWHHDYSSSERILAAVPGEPVGRSYGVTASFGRKKPTGRLNNLSPKNATDHTEKSASVTKRDVRIRQGRTTASIIVSICQRLNKLNPVNWTSVEEFKLLIASTVNC